MASQNKGSAFCCAGQLELCMSFILTKKQIQLLLRHSGSIFLVLPAQDLREYEYLDVLVSTTMRKSMCEHGPLYMVLRAGGYPRSRLLWG